LKTNKLIYFLLASGLLLAMACKHDPVVVPDDDNGNGGDPGNDTTDPGGITCDPDTVYFQNDILPLLQSSCGIAGCHDPGTAEDDVILTDYQNIIQTGEIVPGNPEESEVYENITEDDPDKIMPPPPNEPLSSEQISMIRTWIEQGAKNNYCDEECDTTNVTFSGIVWNTINNSCTGCHSGGSPQGGIFLENYDDVVAMAESGRLMGAINWEPGYANMPQNGEQLSECKRRAIEIWIEDGMPNN